MSPFFKFSLIYGIGMVLAIRTNAVGNVVRYILTIFTNLFWTTDNWWHILKIKEVCQHYVWLYPSLELSVSELIFTALPNYLTRRL